MFSWFEATQPERLGAIQHNAAAFEAEAQAPLLIIRAQMLQGRIEQQPVDRHRPSGCEARCANGHQLGGGFIGKCHLVAQAAVQPPVQPCLAGADSLSPGQCGIGHKPVTPRGEGGHLQFHHAVCARIKGAQRRLPVELDHHVGAGPQRGALQQWPVAHP